MNRRHFLTGSAAAQAAETDSVRYCRWEGQPFGLYIYLLRPKGRKMPIMPSAAISLVILPSLLM